MPSRNGPKFERLLHVDIQSRLSDTMRSSRHFKLLRTFVGEIFPSTTSVICHTVQVKAYGVLYKCVPYECIEAYWVQSNTSSYLLHIDITGDRLGLGLKLYLRLLPDLGRLNILSEKYKLLKFSSRLCVSDMSGISSSQPRPSNQNLVCCQDNWYRV